MVMNNTRRVGSSHYNHYNCSRDCMVSVYSVGTESHNSSYLPSNSDSGPVSLVYSWWTK